MLSMTLLFDQSGMLPYMLFAAFVHELGHFAAIILCRGRVNLLTLGFIGLKIDYRGQEISYGGEILIALMGPFSNIVVAALATLFGQRLFGESLFFFVGLNAWAAILNLVPITQLDGGRALYAALALWRGDVFATKLSCMISLLCIFLLLVAGFCVFLYSHWNISLLAIALWLFVGYCKNYENGIQLGGKFVRETR